MSDRGPSQPQDETTLDKTKKVAASAGKLIGTQYKWIKNKAEQADLKGKVNAASSKVAKAYEENTGRDAKKDGQVAKVAAVGAAAVGGVMLAGQVLVTGVVVGAGCAAAAVYATSTGRGDLVTSAKTGISKAIAVTKEVVGSAQQGFTSAATPPQSNTTNPRSYTAYPHQYYPPPNSSDSTSQRPGSSGPSSSAYSCPAYPQPYSHPQPGYYGTEPPPAQGIPVAPPGTLTPLGYPVFPEGQPPK